MTRFSDAADESPENELGDTVRFLESDAGSVSESSFRVERLLLRDTELVSNVAIGGESNICLVGEIDEFRRYSLAGGPEVLKRALGVESAAMGVIGRE